MILIFVPDNEFPTGEVVTISYTEGVLTSEGFPLEESLIYSFTVEASGFGSFVIDSQYDLPDAPVAIAAFDVDNDSDLDFVAARIILFYFRMPLRPRNLAESPSSSSM